MVPAARSSAPQKETTSAGKPHDDSSPVKKNKTKVPLKIHKSEREKLKRDGLNALFIELGQTLEPAQQNNSKASILGDACKILRHLVSQVESLRKEHAALFSETQYVNAENHELKDETTALSAEIEKLQNEVRDRLGCISPENSSVIAAVTSVSLPAMPVQQQSLVKPVYVTPVHQNFQADPEAGIEMPEPDPCSLVRKPQARYPTPLDSWPNKILSQQPKICEAQNSASPTTTAYYEKEKKSSLLELNLLK